MTRALIILAVALWLLVLWLTSAGASENARPQSSGRSPGLHAVHVGSDGELADALRAPASQEQTRTNALSVCDQPINHDGDAAITLADVGYALSLVGTRCGPTCYMDGQQIRGAGWEPGSAIAKSWIDWQHDPLYWYTTEPMVTAAGDLYGFLGVLAFRDGPGRYLVRVSQGAVRCTTEIVIP